FRVAFPVEYLEQAPLPDQARAEELRDEAFVAVIRPYVLQHLQRVARSGNGAEPFAILLRRVHADSLHIGHDAETQRIGVEAAEMPGIIGRLVDDTRMRLEEFQERAVGDLPPL